MNKNQVTLETIIEYHRNRYLKNIEIFAMIQGLDPELYDSSYEDISISVLKKGLFSNGVVELLSNENQEIIQDVCYNVDKLVVTVQNAISYHSFSAELFKDIVKQLENKEYREFIDSNDVEMKVGFYAFVSKNEESAAFHSQAVSILENIEMPENLTSKMELAMYLLK